MEYKMYFSNSISGLKRTNPGKNFGHKLAGRLPSL
jgi:hypothetical protein